LYEIDDVAEDGRGNGFRALLTACVIWRMPSQVYGLYTVTQGGTLFWQITRFILVVVSKWTEIWVTGFKYMGNKLYQ